MGSHPACRIAKVLLCVTYVFLMLAPASAGADALDNWEVRTSGTASDLYNITYDGGKFVAVGADGSITTSTDGITWTSQTLTGGGLFYGVTYGNGTFVASGQGGAVVTSTDGSSWTSRTTPTSAMLYCAAYGNGTFVVVGMGGTVISSNDGVTWTKQTSDTTKDLYGVAYGNNRFVVVGTAGLLLTSPDGATWTSHDGLSANTNWLDQLTWSGSLFVAAGQAGTIVTSPDGTTWTARTSGAICDYYCVAYGTGGFVAVGAGGCISTSTDGATWVSRPSGVSNYLRGVTWGLNTCIASGFSGIILRSDPITTGAPVAHAGSNQAVVVGATVTLDGSKSYDPDGGSITYAWQLTSLPALSSATLANPTNVKPTFVPDVQGDYTASLTVTDTQALTSQPSSVTLTATTAPVANAGPDQIVPLGAKVVLDGTASSTADGSEPAYSWEFVSRAPGSSATMTGMTTAQPTFIADAQGQYRVSLVVSDSYGRKSTADEVVITAGSASAALPSGGGGDSGSSGGGGCMIATAVYGSPFAYEVTVLRQFRDRHLLTNKPGRAFVSAYYRWSPPVADYISRHTGARIATRCLLGAIVYGVSHPNIALFSFFCAVFLGCIYWGLRRPLHGQSPRSFPLMKRMIR